MVVELEGGKYVIRRGAAYFAFLVDSDGASWTTQLSEARRYALRSSADLELAELRRRNALNSKASRLWVEQE